MEQEKFKIKNIKVPIDDIVLLEKNPRDITDDDLQQLITDIKTDPAFLLQRPPLLNKVGEMFYCYAGTQRVKACIELGYSHIKCFVEENVPERVQDQRMLADNLHRGTWNHEKLEALDFEMFELKEIGFDNVDIALFDDDLEFPKNFTAPKTNKPPTIKITFEDEKQLIKFEKHLKKISDDFEGISYSVSLGEI